MGVNDEGLCPRIQTLSNRGHGDVETRKKGLLCVITLAAISIIWLVLRTGRKPSRISYPCQMAAVMNVEQLFIPLIASLGLSNLHFTTSRLPIKRIVRSALVIGSVAVVFSIPLFQGLISPSPSNDLMVQLALEDNTAATAAETSSLFFVKEASGANGNMDDAFSTLLALMQSHNLYFYKTEGQLSGLIAKNDVVLIKVNAVGPERSGTNTDLVKSLITTILNHPEGFTGEIVIADNGQITGGLDLEKCNSYSQSQSFQDVANMFEEYRVSAYSWYAMRSKIVKEYSLGDYSDGYVLDSNADPITTLQVSYAKFKTKFGTYISFQNGVWNPSTRSYDSQRLKIINFPVIKSHHDFGATGSVKNYMGVQSQALSDMHNKIPFGALGTEMVKTRFPTLTLLDAIWVNANPWLSGGNSNCGPITPYTAASYTNILGASLDPVALDYWAAKNILIPTAISRGYTFYSSMDPDYEPLTPGLVGSFHVYLENAANVLKNAGYQVTMTPSQMNVYTTRAQQSLRENQPCLRRVIYYNRYFTL